MDAPDAVWGDASDTIRVVSILVYNTMVYLHISSSVSHFCLFFCIGAIHWMDRMAQRGQVAQLDDGGQTRAMRR